MFKNSGINYIFLSMCRASGVGLVKYIVIIYKFFTMFLTCIKVLVTATLLTSFNFRVIVF